MNIQGGQPALSPLRSGPCFPCVLGIFDVSNVVFVCTSCTVVSFSTTDVNFNKIVLKNPVNVQGGRLALSPLRSGPCFPSVLGMLCIKCGSS